MAIEKSLRQKHNTKIEKTEEKSITKQEMLERPVDGWGRAETALSQSKPEVRFRNLT